ncbi:MAG: hypothetical protein JO316_10205 [Abitibacteriaceae bacterium]|nr:hypothetical protein [Abditibacteriaceae bacterium]MBV9865713.1 hypothetical protein [Abditibacteriaceae bacterium]
MNTQIYGFVGIALGLLVSVIGVSMVFAHPSEQGVFGLILLLSGALVFGSGLIAAAIGARK